MERIIPDPDFEEFDGIYVGDNENVLPFSKYDLSKLGSYMREKNKLFNELSKEELKSFEIS